MVAIKFAAILLALSTEVFAGAPDPVCTSKLGTVSIASNKIPRATSTVVQKVTVVKKIIRKINVIVYPVPRTTTLTETAETVITQTADPNVEIATTVVTDEQTTVSTRSFADTTVSTSYSVTTKLIPTTVAAPAVFTPIRNMPGYVAKRDELEKRAKPQPVAGPLKNGKIVINGIAEYITRIDCQKKVSSTSIKTVHTTVKGPKRTLKAATKTKVTTTTTTSIETEYPADVTNTITETLYPTTTVFEDVTSSTSTIVETVTVETQVPDTPYYAACGNDNILSSANGGLPIKYLLPSFSEYTTQIVSGKDAYSCCAECHKRPNCLMSAVPTSAGNQCILYLTKSATCPSEQFTWASWYSTHESGTYLMSNGPCGKASNGGIFN